VNYSFISLACSFISQGTSTRKLALLLVNCSFITIITILFLFYYFLLLLLALLLVKVPPQGNSQGTFSI